MTVNLPKSKPAKTGGLAGYPKNSVNAFKLGQIGYFDSAPDSRWIKADGGQYTSVQYPDLAKLYQTTNPVMGAQIPSMTSPPGIYYPFAISSDATYIASQGGSGGSAQMNAWKRTGDQFAPVGSIMYFLGGSQTLKCVAWSPDDKYVAFGMDIAPTFLIAKQVAGVFTPLTMPALPVTAVTSVAWVDSDYVVINGTYAFTVINDVVTQVANAFSPNQTQTITKVIGNTPSKQYLVTFSVASSGIRVYQRINNIMTLVADITTEASPAVYGVEVIGDAEYILYGSSISNVAASIYIYTKDSKSWSYRKFKYVEAEAPTPYVLQVDPTRTYLYCMGFGGSAGTHLALFNNGNPIPLGANTDMPTLTAVSSASTSMGFISKDGKYLIYAVSATPFIAGAKLGSTYLDKFFVPSAPDKFKLGRRLTAFIKAKT